MNYARQTTEDASSGLLKDLLKRATSLGGATRVVVQRHLRESEHAARHRASFGEDPDATVTMEAGAVPQTYEEWVEAVGRKGRWIDGGCS
eukprot:1988926-Alexandrium_andersonii.AAC.1